MTSLSRNPLLPMSPPPSIQRGKARTLLSLKRKDACAEPESEHPPKRQSRSKTEGAEEGEVLNEEQELPSSLPARPNGPPATSSPPNTNSGPSRAVVWTFVSRTLNIYPATIVPTESWNAETIRQIFPQGAIEELWPWYTKRGRQHLFALLTADAYQEVTGNRAAYQTEEITFETLHKSDTPAPLYCIIRLHFNGIKYTTIPPADGVFNQYGAIIPLSNPGNSTPDPAHDTGERPSFEWDGQAPIINRAPLTRGDIQLPLPRSVTWDEFLAVSRELLATRAQIKELEQQRELDQKEAQLRLAEFNDLVRTSDENGRQLKAQIEANQARIQALVLERADLVNERDDWRQRAQSVGTKPALPEGRRA